MISTCFSYRFPLTLLVLSSVMALAQDASFEALRSKALNRPRLVLYNTDGCDALYFPKKWEGTPEALKRHRLLYTKNTCIDTVLYCPICSGFGHMTYRTDVGDRLLADPPHVANARNVTKELMALGTDPLAVARDYCREQNLEFFASIRFNDTHDQVHSEKEPFFLMPPFKLAHPEFLMGSREKKPPRCAWSAVDFTHAEVRTRQIAIVREICANYDVDGIEYDFMRHMQLLKSVAWDGIASIEELDIMTEFMRELRATTEDIGRRRGRPILVAIRVPDSLEYCRAVGIDLERWLREKLLDIEIASGYFQLNKWRVSAELAHRHGVKFYASLDESRIKAPQAIPGRNSPAFYAARIAAAMADGCDGIYHFNLEYAALNYIARINPLKTEGCSKLYYGTERGSGGYRSWHYLKNGESYNNLPKLDPAEPLKLTADKPYEFTLTVGDDLKSQLSVPKPPNVSVEVATNLQRADRLKLVCNGQTLVPVSFQAGCHTFALPLELIVKGENSFRLELMTASDSQALIYDFVLKIDYAEEPPQEFLQALKAETYTNTYLNINCTEGKLDITGQHTNSYLSACVLPEEQGVRLIHNAGTDHAKAYQHVNCIDKAIVNGCTGIVVAKWRCKAISRDKGPLCFQVAMAPSRIDGQVVEMHCKIGPDSIVCNLGEVKLDTIKTTEWNDYAIMVNMDSRMAALFINGKLVCQGITGLGGNRPEGFCIVGDGSGGIFGVVALSSFSLGTIQP